MAEINSNNYYRGTLKEFLEDNGYTLKGLCEEELEISRGSGQRALRGEICPTFYSAFHKRFPNVVLLDIDTSENIARQSINLDVHEDMLINLDIIMAEIDRTRQQLDYITKYVSDLKYKLSTGRTPEEMQEVADKKFVDVDEELLIDDDAMGSLINF